MQKCTKAVAACVSCKTHDRRSGVGTNGCKHPCADNKKDLDADGDLGLRPGDTLSLFDLLKLGLVASSNDAMTAAAASLGSNYLTAMNDMANKLGLTKTYFLNPTGLDVNHDSAGAYGSAYDVARLASAFTKNIQITLA